MINKGKFIGNLKPLIEVLELYVLQMVLSNTEKRGKMRKLPSRNGRHNKKRETN